MNNTEHEALLRTLREQFDDEKVLDEIDINYLFGIIDSLKRKCEIYEQIIREGRHKIRD